MRAMVSRGIEPISEVFHIDPANVTLLSDREFLMVRFDLTPAESASTCGGLCGIHQDNRITYAIKHE